MAGLESVVVLEVIREHREELQKYILTDIKEVSCTGRGKEPPENDEKDLNGAGAYGNLVALECRNGTQVAGKVLHSIFFTSGTEPNGVRKLLTKFFEEIKLLSKMNHPNIVQFLGMYYREGSLLPVIVMEKMECDLSQFLKAHKKGSLPDDRVLGILLDVSKGLVYLHEEMKIAHRDLSSNNILLTSNQSAKIADLGSARVLDKPGGWDTETKLTEQPGTTDFMPPEALEDPPKYTVSVDVFSFGCVIIHLCTHKWPNPIGKTAQGKIISELDRRHKYISEINQSYLLPLIKQCLEDVDTNRPTSSTIMSILQAKVEENASNVDYTIILSGVPGMGKSTAGNFFLNMKSFPTEEGFLSCTEHCLVSTSIICGKKIKIIDTPGVFDKLASTEGNFKELSRALTLAKDGIHAFAFVMRYGRFTKACKEAIQHLQLLKGVLPFVFVLLTHAKRNGVTTTQTAEYIEQCLTSNRCAPGFRNLMEVVESRVIMLEAEDHIAEDYHQQKCNELLMMVEKIRKRNGNKVYTNIVLQHAAEVYEHVKQQQGKEVQTVMESLESNSQKIEQLKQQMNDTANDKTAADKIGKDITVLLKENEGLEKRLEEINNEQYLVQLTNEILENEILKDSFKGSLLDYFSTAAFSTVGGAVGGAFGMMGGSKYTTSMGFAAGAAAGGALGKTIMDRNCNQQ